MEGIGFAKYAMSKHGRVQCLPRMLSLRQQEHTTSLPRLVLSSRMNGLSDNPRYRLNLMGHYGCVNAIEFSNKGGEYLASGGDDRRVLLWNIDEALQLKYDPKSMKGEHHSNIFCLAFDNDNGKIFSGGNDDQVIVHDTRRGEAVDVFLHEDAVYGLAVDPRNDNIYASACADGRVLLWDIRAPSHHEPFTLANYVTAFHAVVYHPQEPRFLATANAKEGIALWDVRSPRSCLLRYGSAYTQMNAMSVRFNQSGTRLLALRRRLPAVLYNIQSSVPAAEFSHEGYYNSCTMKSCCFGGDRDEFVLSGSDDFNLYIWKVPHPKEEIQQVTEAFAVLKGHRQIVNQVRFSPRTFMIASSGVEKVIKLWSAMKCPGMTDGNESPRKMFTRQQYLNLMISSGSALSHDYSEKSKEEDPRMLAFFDSFIQREVNHSLSSDSSDDSALSPDSLYLHFVRDHSDANSSDGDGSLRPSLLPPELGMMSDSESDLDSHLINGRTSSPKTTPKVQGDQQSVTSSSEAAGSSVAGAAGQTRSTQENESRTGTSDVANKRSTSQTSNGSEASSSSRRSRQRSRSATDSSSSSDESEDFLVMRYRSRLLRRIMRQKSKKAKDSGASGRFVGSEPSQLEKDRLASLQQRIAFSRVMKERFTAASDTDSSPSDDNEQFLALVGQLRQRTDSARQRAVSLRRHRMRALEELSSLTGGLTRSTASSSLSSRSPQRHSSTNSGENVSRLASTSTNHPSPSNTSKRVKRGQTDPSDSVNSLPPNQSQSKEKVSSPCKSKSKLKNTRVNLDLDVPSTSDGGKSHPLKKDAAGCSMDINHGKADTDRSLSGVSKDSQQASGSTKDGHSALDLKDGAGSKNGFKKFKVSSSGKKRHYRNTNCYSRRNESDSD